MVCIVKNRARLTFQVPLLRWTPDQYIAQRELRNQASIQDARWHDSGRLLSIWGLAGSARRRCGRAERADLRMVFKLLRRSWEAHSAADDVASALYFERARNLHDHLGALPLLMAGIQLFSNRTKAGNVTARQKKTEHDEIALYALMLLESGVRPDKLRIAIERTDGIGLSSSQINRILRSYGLRD